MQLAGSYFTWLFPIYWRNGKGPENHPYIKSPNRFICMFMRGICRLMQRSNAAVLLHFHFHPFQGALPYSINTSKQTRNSNPFNSHLTLIKMIKHPITPFPSRKPQESFDPEIRGKQRHTSNMAVRAWIRDKSYSNRAKSISSSLFITTTVRYSFYLWEVIDIDS